MGAVVMTIHLSFYEIFGIMAGIASFVAITHYVIAIFKKGTRPSQAAWWSWGLIALVYATSNWAADASWQVLILPVWLCFSQLFVAVLSLRYGDSKWDKLNLWCVVGAIIAGFGITVWHSTGDPRTALIIAIIADCFASVPNFRHAWTHPEEEDRFGWLFGWISAIFALLAIEHRNLTDASFGIYFFFTMTAVMILVWRPYRKRIKIHIQQIGW